MWICVLVCFQTINELLLEKNRIFYKYEFQDLKKEKVYISICLKVGDHSSSEYDCTDLKDKNASETCEKLKEFLDYVETHDNLSPFLILKKFDDLKIPKLWNLDGDQVNRYLNFKNLCFTHKIAFSEAFKSDNISHTIRIENLYNISGNYFVHQKEVPMFIEKVEYLFCNNFRYCNYFGLHLKQFIRRQLKPPYESNCAYYSKLKKFTFEKYEPINLRSGCLIECLKYEYRLSEFFYSENDNETLKINGDSNYEAIEDSRVNFCRSKCRYTDCEFTFYLFYNKHFHNDNAVIIQLDAKNFYFYAIEYWPLIDLVIKFLGILNLFTRVSFLSLILSLVHLVRTCLRNKILISILSILLWSSLVLGIFGCYYYSYYIYKQFISKNIDKFNIVETPFKPGKI